MSHPKTRTTRPGEPEETPQTAGDNRRAGDTDGNKSGGHSKSKGAENPARRPE
jgi:hypothetical protein